MPDASAVTPLATPQAIDRQLLSGLMLPPIGAGVNTIVGFTVAHWITIAAYKRTGYLVSLCSFAMCAVGAWLAWTAQSRLSATDETLPRDGRQLFMAKLGLLLSALCAIVVLAGTLVLVTLRPSD